MKRIMLSGIVFFACLSGVWGQAEERGDVVYRCYQRLESELLDSLKKAAFPFKGVTALKREAEALKENSRVAVELRQPGHRKMDGERLAEERQGSVLLLAKYLQATTRPEQVLTWASAVVLSENGVCVTNYHVLRELIDTTVRLDVRDSLLFVSTWEGKVYPIKRVLSYSKVADVALFEVDTRGERLRPMPVGEDLTAGNKVFTLTNPVGYPWTLTDGVASRTVEEVEGNPFSRRLEITADFAKGSSGGAILDERGNLVAMVSRISPIYYVDYPPRDLQMNVKYVVPVSVLRLLLEE